MWRPRQKVMTLQKAMEWREQFVDQALVWTNGTFDMLHPGHVSSLQHARQLGDALIVGVNSDRSVKAYKGPTRPVLNEQERAAMLAALECVDAVLIFDEDTPEESLRQLKPNIHCKGVEYAPPHGRPVPERAVVESYGGRIEYLPLVPGVSTTDLLRRIAMATEGHDA
jgi:D-glycero-beta-D-manno-heptose 1-phosphate adenylyltransferase